MCCVLVKTVEDNELKNIMMTFQLNGKSVKYTFTEVAKGHMLYSSRSTDTCLKTRRCTDSTYLLFKQK